MARAITPPLERLMNLTMPVTECGCLLFLGSLTNGGYGCFYDGTRLRLAHRVSYELHRGEMPDRMQIDHLCRVRCCVNPDHLEPVTHAENLRRGSGVPESTKEATRARAKLITHCPKGHEYTPENTRIKQGKRACKACDRDRHNARYAHTVTSC